MNIFSRSFRLTQRELYVAPIEIIMCGILLSFHERGETCTDVLLHAEFDAAKDTLKHRGPDSSCTIVDSFWRFDFHRLIINGLSVNCSQQPFQSDSGWIICCNGEIYNHQQLGLTSDDSDCSILRNLFDDAQHLSSDGAPFMFPAELIDGVFAIAAVHVPSKTVLCARDVFGVRPLFTGIRSDGVRMVASEQKALKTCQYIRPIAPGTVEVFHSSRSYVRRYPTPFGFRLHDRLLCKSPTATIPSVEHALLNAVFKRVTTFARGELGCFLSGGLDSSLIAAMACRFKPASSVHTFSIGLDENSVDIVCAREVAQHLGTNHHEVIVSAEEMLAAIPEVVALFETHDVTTIRAGTPMCLLSRYIRRSTNCKVILSGEGADEICGGYLYLKNAPTNQAFDEECRRLALELHLFDVLRADRAVSGSGLELRVPFLDPQFVNAYWNIPVDERTSTDKPEKNILRDIAYKYLPTNIASRRKEAFSDGVSTQADSWYKIIQDYALTKVPESIVYPPHCGREAERLWIMDLFDRCEYAKIVDHLWLPRWTTVQDPSARALALYNND